MAYVYLGETAASFSLVPKPVVVSNRSGVIRLMNYTPNDAWVGFLKRLPDLIPKYLQLKLQALIDSGKYSPSQATINQWQQEAAATTEVPTLIDSGKYIPSQATINQWQQEAAATTEVPITQKAWFWPVVVGSVVLIGFMFNRRK